MLTCVIKNSVKNTMKYLLFFITTILGAKSVHSMEHNRLHVVTIPGQRNYTGIDDDHVRSIFGQNITITKVATPRMTPDFGQACCLSNLQQAIQSKQRASEQTIFYARSQGTATALNYVARTDAQQHVHALVLEAVLASGNSAICHTIAQSWPRLSLLTKLPCSDYWLPYLAKAVFWRYCPSGQQPITSLERIPTDLPIIITHATGDRELPYQDALALYYGLRKRGNKNVYLIAKSSSRHTEILEEYSKEVIRAMLQKHGIETSDTTQTHTSDTSFTLFQPAPDEFKTDYNTLIGKEKNHKRLGHALSIASCAAILYALHAAYTNLYNE